MTSPFLASAKSGFQGRGYKAIFEEEPVLVPSVTTVLGAVASPALTQWAVNQTCAYYAANPEAVFNKSVEASYYMGLWYGKRKPEFDSSDYDPYNYHKGVLQEAADQGTWIHEFVEATLNDDFEPTPQNAQHEQMAEAFVLWLMDNDVTPVITEKTVYGVGYAGTLDGIAHINGKLTLFDTKSSRAVHESHRAQLSALGAAHTMATECDPKDEGAVKHTRTLAGVKDTKWFKPEPLPAFTDYGVLQIRPDDYNNKGEFVPAFCEFHPITNEVIDASFGIFQGALQIKQAQRAVGLLIKDEEAEDE